MPRSKGNVECICEQCGEHFFKFPAAIRNGRGRFCKRACLTEWMQTAFKGRTGYYHVSGPKHHAWRGVTIPIPCPVCGEMFSRITTRQVTCGKECGMKVRTLRISGNWNAPPREGDAYRISVKHRLIKCERCGKQNAKRFVVHHKDRNHHNNDIPNLEVLCDSCHRKEHASD